MLYALTSAYSRKDYDNQQQGLPMQTNIGKLFSIFAWGLDIVHENAELVKQWDDLEQAKGAVLDRYGANWGVQRFSENDALYRLTIRIKILSQLSGGDTDTVIKAAAELLGVENSDIGFEDVPPAKIALSVDWKLLTQERKDLIEPIAWAIKRIVASGVGMRLYIRTYRTYRYDLPVHHGGAIMTRFRYEPVGQDRAETWDVNISRGGTATTRSICPPVGTDRSHLYPLSVARGGAVGSGFSYSPVSEGRSHAQPVPMVHGAMIQSGYSPPPVSQSRSHAQPVSVAHGGAMPPVLTGALPDTEKSVKGRQNSAGVAYTRVHIKPKRID